MLPEPEHVLTARAQRVSVAGEEIELSPRFYNPEPLGRAVRRLSDVQRLITACSYSRQHDGHVRQSACAAILPSAEPWVAPYVVQLLGQYAVEIAAMILERLTAQSSFGWPAYRDFVRATSAFMVLTEQRAISCWSCYYRHDFVCVEYPALVALDRLRQNDPR